MSHIDLNDFELRYDLVEDEICMDVDIFWDFVNQIKEETAKHISKVQSKKIEELEQKIEDFQKRELAASQGIDPKFAKPVKFDPAIHADRSKYGYIYESTFNAYGKSSSDTFYVHRSTKNLIDKENYKLFKITPVEEPIEKDVEREG